MPVETDPGHFPDRSYNKSSNNLETCQCGALVVIPNGHDALDDDKETPILCDECDKPLGKKLFETFAINTYQGGDDG